MHAMNNDKEDDTKQKGALHSNYKGLITVGSLPRIS